MADLSPERFINSTAGRYRFQVIDGEQAIFRKSVAKTEIAHLLRGELLWNDFMAQVEELRPELQVRSPRVLDFQDGDHIDIEYVDAPFLARPENAGHLPAHINRLADTLLAMDIIAEGWAPTVDIDREKERAPYDHIDKRWDAWLEQPLRHNLITPPMVQLAREQVHALQHHIQPRLQHGDFTPWHIFVTNGEWIIFDAEHTSPFKPRFYDLAYMYSRIFTRLNNKFVAFALLQRFASGVNMEQDDFFRAFLPVLTSRTMGTFLDALNDKQDGADYTAASTELYMRCLQGDIRALTEA